MALEHRDTCIRARPASLTLARAESLLATMDINPEWQQKSDAGELPEGIEGCFGMFDVIPSNVQPTREEAEWILALLEFGSWRWMASVVLNGDDNQVHAMHLIEASQRVLGQEVL